MSENLPDFTPYGYQLRTELGQNRLGGRTTYLATNSLGYPVVIKQFQFATSGSTWGEYEAYQQEITMLRRLQHPGIPRYLDAFQTPDGFCMVQQYIPGESLAAPRNWTPQEIKHIALATLEILTYLQSQHPPIIHRDIKPENILVDEQLNIHLVDFGFARMGGGEIAASSVVKGTMGFMPPEQLFNRQLTTASDLYGLGATLICLLTGTKSGDIGNLIDADYQIHFQHLVPPLKRGWINWLAKITAPKVAERYPSAAAALAALQPIDVDRLPKLIISHNSLQFTATKWQEKVSQIVTLSNPIPETLLAGQFSVAPHASDPPHTPYDHAWISFQPANFEGNEVNCEITVDTSKLLAATSYTREVWVQSNANTEPEVIPVTVQTAPLPKPISIAGWLGLVLLLALSGLGGLVLTQIEPEPLLFPLVAFVMTAEGVAWAVARGIEVNVLAVLAAFIGSLMGQGLFRWLVGSLGLGVGVFDENILSIITIISSMIPAFIGAIAGGKLAFFIKKIAIKLAGFIKKINFKINDNFYYSHYYNSCLWIFWLFFLIIFYGFLGWGIIKIIMLKIPFLWIILFLVGLWCIQKCRHIIMAILTAKCRSNQKTKANPISNISLLWPTMMMGVGLGLNFVMTLALQSTTNTVWSSQQIIWIAPPMLMGLMLILLPVIKLAFALKPQLQLNAYVTKYSKNQLSLIKP